MSAAIAPNPNDPQAPLGMPARPWWIGYIRQLHLDIPLAVESGGTGKNTPLDASDIAETSALKILTADERTKLAGIAEGAEVNAVDSVAGRTGDVTLDADDVAPTTTKLWMSDTQSTKLAGIAEGANNYTHPATHPQSMIEGLADALAAKAPVSTTVTTNTTQTITGVKHWDTSGTGNEGFIFDRYSIRTVRANITIRPNAVGTYEFYFGNATYPYANVWLTYAGSVRLPTVPSAANDDRAVYSSWVNAKAAGALLTEGTPSGPTATGTKGMARFDADYFYVCTATNTWVRFAKDGSWT